jgi:hypothetical protein
MLFNKFYCLLLQQAGLPLVQQYLFQFERLVREHMPKLGQHFIEEMINPSMYASQWFITVFSYSFPFHITLRVWDVFLYEVRILSFLFMSGVYHFLWVELWAVLADFASLFASYSLRLEI